MLKSVMRNKLDCFDYSAEEIKKTSSEHTILNVPKSGLENGIERACNVFTLVDCPSSVDGY